MIDESFIRETQKEGLMTLIDTNSIRANELFYFYPNGEIVPYMLTMINIQKGAESFRKAIGLMKDLVDQVSPQLNFDVVVGSDYVSSLFSIPTALNLGKSHLLTDSTVINRHNRFLKRKKVIYVGSILNNGTTLEKTVDDLNSVDCDVLHAFFYVDKNICTPKFKENIGTDINSVVFLDSRAWEELKSYNLINNEKLQSILQWKENKKEWALRTLRSPEGVARLASFLNNLDTKFRASTIISFYSEIRDDILEKLKPLNVLPDIGSYSHQKRTRLNTI